MLNIIWSSILLAAIPSFSEAYLSWDFGDGFIHKLNVVQDVTLERRSNMDRLNYLLVGRHIYYPLKRSLVQFENLRSTCPLNKIRFAKMYLYFHYQHGPGWVPARKKPFLKHTLQVYRVLKSWNEREATIQYRKKGFTWRSRLLNIGRDTESELQCGCSFDGVSKCLPTTLSPLQPPRYIEFDVTKAVRSWRKGAPNYGLLLKVVNEKINSRDIRFYSKYHKNPAQHPFIYVTCNY